MVGEIEPNDIVIFELSAHQLEFINNSPHISVLLNVFPEHLDYFDSFSKYRDAKFNIYRHQKAVDKLIIITSLQKEAEATVMNKILVKNKIATDLENIPVIGNHNKINAEFAITAVIDTGISRDEAIQSLMSFRSLPHRLEMVVEKEGVVFINDSISTIPESAIAAIKAIEKVDILILGGYDRGLNYNKLVEYLKISKVRVLVFLGNAGKRIQGLIPSDSNMDCFFANDMENVFEILNEVGNHGDICLLSPAAASYDQFKNFEHRGDKFKELSNNFRK